MANRGEPDPKKSTESICSLTKPQLYSLYDDDVVRSEDNEIYEELKRSVSIDSTKYSRDQTIDSTFYLADKVGARCQGTQYLLIIWKGYYQHHPFTKTFRQERDKLVKISFITCKLY